VPASLLPFFPSFGVAARLIRVPASLGGVDSLVTVITIRLVMPTRNHSFISYDLVRNGMFARE